MNPTTRMLIVSLVASSTTVHAQTASGDVGGKKSCSQLVAECVAFNKKGGYDTSRCAEYKAACMATGTYQDRNRTITGVSRR